MGNTSIYEIDSYLEKCTFIFKIQLTAYQESIFRLGSFFLAYCTHQLGQQIGMSPLKQFLYGIYFNTMLLRIFGSNSPKIGSFKTKTGVLQLKVCSCNFFGFKLLSQFFVLLCIFMTSELAHVGTLLNLFTHPLRSLYKRDISATQQSYTNREFFSKNKDNSKIKIHLQGQPEQFSSF